MRRPARLLVQYVPQAFGWKGMNVPFCLWLAGRRRESVWVMFHEVACPVGRELPWRRNVLGWVTRWMAGRVARAAERVFVSTPSWTPMLRELAPTAPPPVWLPVPSNLPTQADLEEAALVRRRLASGPGDALIGHFGTYGGHIAPLLTRALPRLLADSPSRRAVLLGRGACDFAAGLERACPSLRGRLVTPGPLTDEGLVAHLAACDVLFQPFPDGVTTRRGSVMAGLALGAPIVTTTGSLTEPVWGESGAVLLPAVDDVGGVVEAVRAVLSRDDLRRRLRLRSAALYRERFAVDRTVEALLAAASAERFVVAPAI
jgi:glycosyltransferase involved in cell wall biosynthesis